MISPCSTASPAFTAARRLTGLSVLLTYQENVCAGQSQPVVVGMIHGGGAKGAEVIDGTGVVQEMGLKGVSAGV